MASLQPPNRVTSVDTTPNPNARKFNLANPISDRPRSFRTEEDATSDPLATALFAIPGVVGILINNDWVTINKHAAADWPSIEPPVKDLLERTDPVS